jgi:hypothetical protein
LKGNSIPVGVSAYFIALRMEIRPPTFVKSKSLRSASASIQVRLIKRLLSKYDFEILSGLTYPIQIIVLVSALI